MPLSDVFSLAFAWLLCALTVLDVVEPKTWWGKALCFVLAPIALPMMIVTVLWYFAYEAWLSVRRTLKSLI